MAEIELGGRLLAPLWMLLAFVGLGVLCARRLSLDPRPIASLLIYVIAPVTVFRGLVLGGPTPAYLLLTLGVFVTACLMCLIVGRLARPFFPAEEASLLAFSAGTANTGYFGLPVAMVLLSPAGVTQYLFCLLGMNLFEFTLGFYVGARGRFSVRESLHKILRLPLIYAFLAALIVSGLALPLPTAMMEGFEVFPPTYTLLGMMIIGMTLGRVSLKELDPCFIGASLAVRFGLWPLVSLGAVLALQATLGIDEELAMALLLIGVVPMAANLVVVAMELGSRAEKAALAVLVSTLLAPLVMPPYLEGLLALLAIG
ncbi:AEC family transporter [Onishia taeanensis]